MAFCPKCKGTMSAMDIECPQCGYVTPGTDPIPKKSGIAYSSLADIALIGSTIAAAFSCLITIYYSVIMLLSGNLFHGFVLGPSAFFLELGMVVVFLRIQDV
jgi:hypothetical protein